VRGLWRDVIFTRWLSLLGLSVNDIPPARAHAFFSGGTIDKGADTGTVQLDVRRQARRLCPPWDLFAGCMDQQIMAGCARVGDAVLVCQETAWQTRDTVAPDVDLESFATGLPAADECTALRLLTRHAHRDIAEAEGVQMLANTEHLIVGTQMVHTLHTSPLTTVSPVTAACLADLLAEFSKLPIVGAGASRGYGALAVTPYAGGIELPPPSLYLEFVEANKAEAVAWVTSVQAAKKGKKEKEKAQADE
jgi:hypothetical protein